MNGLPNGIVSGGGGGSKSSSKGGKKGSKNNNRPDSRSRVAMYCVKRPYEISDVTLPNTMYNVDPIQRIHSDNIEDLPVSNSDHSSIMSSPSGGNLAAVNYSTSTSSSLGSSRSVNDDQVAALELRQLQIIDKLARLREVITGIHEKCVLTGTIPGKEDIHDKISSATSSLTSVAPKETEFLEVINIVVNANPRRPPLSVLYLANKLEKSYRNAKTSVTSHVHSSYKGIIDAKHIKAFQKPVENANFKFHVIWREVAHSSLLVSPIKATQITKEPNMARFLSRLLPPSDSLNYDCLNWDRLVTVDGILERANSKKLLEVISQELNRSKKQFLVGELTIADLVMYSVVKSKLNAGLKEKDLPANVAQWTQNMSQLYKDTLGK